MARVLEIHITRAKCMSFHKKRKHRAIRARRKDTRALYVLSARLFYNRSTVEPRYNEGPRDWQTSFAITRFRYIEVLFIYSTKTVLLGGKKIDRSTEDFVI